MTNISKKTCPHCGALMNHHAVKIEYDADELSDSVFEGVLRNVHTCSECGAVEMTTAE